MQPLGENTINTPAFLGKLWKMVNDPSTDHLICWSPSGTSFVIQNQAQFWYELLPLYYKHNNMSSFVRQLNMYGFHKLSTVENGSMDADKDEIQFTHPFFVKDQPELLRNIKRKAAAPKTNNENSGNPDDLTKVLTDVKQLRGRQASVDNQLNAMKQENALLWREVALLRQKHLKQQKIVNKLIQFLVTLVQPSRMTVGVKRGYQLMLNESPSKKRKAGNSNKNSNNLDGPTIHELDSELDLPPSIYDEEAVIESPATDVASHQTEVGSPLQSQAHAEKDHQEENAWDKPEYISVDTLETPDHLELVETDLTDENLIDTLGSETSPVTINVVNGIGVDNQKVFLNPSAQDTLLSNLVKDNAEKKNDDKSTEGIEPKTSSSLPTNVNTNMAVATRDRNLCDIVKSLPSTSDPYMTDLNSHLESTHSELEQFKDILNNYNSYVDANTLLGELNHIVANINDTRLFQDESPDYDLNLNADDRTDNLIDSSDPLVSGSELAPYGGTFDFTELFDDSVDADNTTVPESRPASSTVNTPQITRDELVFPVLKKGKNC